MMGRCAACLLATLSLLALTACQAPSSSDLPPPPSDSGGVQLDWGALTDYEPPENQYTRRYDNFADHLIPAGDYGPLIPFPGRRVYTEWMGDTWLYGLVTQKGEIIVDPVYSTASVLRQYDMAQGHSVYLPYLLLEKVDYDPAAEKEVWDITVAALDGSWARDSYTLFAGGSSDVLLLGTADGYLEALSSDGSLRWRKSFAELNLPDTVTEFGETLSISEGVACYWDNYYAPERTVYYLNTADGTLTQRSGGGLPGVFSDGLAAAWQEQDGQTRYGYVDHTGAWVIAPQYIAADPFRDGIALVQLPDQTQALIDQEGTVLLHCTGGELLSFQDPDGARLYLEAVYTGERPLGEFYRAEQYCVNAAYDKNLQPHETPAAGEMILWYYNGYWLNPGDNLWENGKLTVGTARSEIALTLPAGYIPYGAVQTDGGMLLHLSASDGSRDTSAFYDSAGRLRIDAAPYTGISETTDYITGKSFLVGHAPDNMRYDLYDSAGSPLLSLPANNWYPQLYGDLILVQDLYGTGLRTLSGEWGFRYLVQDTDM